MTGLTDGDRYLLTVTAADAAGTAPSTSTPPLVVGVPATVTGRPTPGVVGHHYRFGFTVAGDPAPTVTVDTGRLPPGLTLSAGGVLTGTATHPGCYQFTVAAVNHVGVAATDTVHLVIRRRSHHRRERQHRR